MPMQMQQQSNQEKNPIVGKMQKNGMSTKDIIKSLAEPMLNKLGMNKDSKGANWIIASDVVHAQTDMKVRDNIQKSDNILDKIGNLGETLAGISQKKPKALSAGLIEDYNSRVSQSNDISVQLWNVIEQVKKSVQDTGVVQSDLVSMSKNGNISGEELSQKLREQHEKAKQSNMTGPNSHIKQSDALANKQGNLEKPVAKMQDDTMKIMNAKGLTKESIKSATPDTEPSAESSPKNESHGSGRGRSGGR
jgi:hypothetical protein